MSQPTHAELMQALGRIEGRLGGLELQLTSMKDDMIRDDEAIVQRQNHHARRLSSLEKFRAYSMGLGSVFGLAGTGFLTYLLKKLGVM